MSFTRPLSIQLIRDEARSQLAYFDDDLNIIEPPPPAVPTDCIETNDDTGDPEEPETGECPYELSDSAFTIRSGADCLLNHDATGSPEMLFGSFWFRYELCILFADTNTGKSILAVQIADSICRGEAIGGFQLEGGAAPVLYFDFELSDQQFRHRYSTEAEVYPMPAGFYRAVLKPVTSQKAKRFATYQEYFNNELENAIIATRAGVLIIDNISSLRYGTHAAGALKLIAWLQSIKNNYSLSILVLAHTPKRNPAKPITRNDLQGSKMLINLCDSAFAIGESSTQPGLRYLKQIKQRSSEQQYGSGNVALCEIKKEGSFLHFGFNGHAHEAQHLMPYTEQQREATAKRITELNAEGKSIRQISLQLGVPTTTIFRVLKRAEKYTD